jgi:peptidoglycan/LPS O-acetylase OafA/YrhL
MASARYRSLDLLRACAIALVITAHTVLAYGKPAALAPLGLGGTGVDLFFVLSGWLLGNQLIKELSRTDSIDVKRFWLRRWMRTLPAYYAVLAFTFLQQIVMHPEKKLQLGYLVFLQNYGDLPYFSVSWSLCVEEYFYLCVAPGMLLLARLRSRWRWVPIALLFFAPFTFRMLGWYHSPDETHVRWDACMLGVLLAVCRVRAPQTWAWLTRAAPVLASVGLTVYLANFAGRWLFAQQDYDKLVYAMIFGSFVLLVARDSWWQEKIYVPGASYIALRAYSLYLLHPEVLALLKRFGLGLPFPIFYLVAWVGSCAVAEVLYRTLEKPIMDLRDRLAAARSAAESPTHFPEGERAA